MPSPGDKAVTEYIAQLLRGMRGPAEEISYDKLAVDLGITKPQIFNIVNHGKGAGPKVEQAFADRLYEGSVDKLRQVARAWWAERVDVAHFGGDPKKLFVELPFRYESLRRVIEHPGNKNRWSSASIAAVKTLLLDCDADPGEAWCTETLIALNAAIKVTTPKLPERRVELLAGLDERPVRPARKKR